jgi:predicted LPLAT superfamily acyltransferase
MSKSVQKSQHWASIQEAGTLFGLKFLWGVHKIFGRKAVSILLYPTVFYFIMFRPASRAASLDFLRTHAKVYPEKWTSTPNIKHSAKHFLEFAETVVDKLLAWCVHIEVDDFDVNNPQAIEELMADERGQLVIGTHMGNLEYCRGFMQRYREKVINILIYDKHAANYAAIMHALNPDSRLNIFQVDDFEVDTMLKLKAKIDQGEWVFIAGDRIPLTGLSRTVDVEFMQRTAPLPIGPYLLAKALGCPVKLMFAYRDYSMNEEKVFFEVVPFAEKIELSRKNRMTDIQAYAQNFAQEFEKHCAKVPYQWFNFFPFWKENTGSNKLRNKQ